MVVAHAQLHIVVYDFLIAVGPRISAMNVTAIFYDAFPGTISVNMEADGGKPSYHINILLL